MDRELRILSFDSTPSCNLSLSLSYCFSSLFLGRFQFHSLIALVLNDRELVLFGGRFPRGLLWSVTIQGSSHLLSVEQAAAGTFVGEVGLLHQEPIGRTLE